MRCDGTIVRRTVHLSRAPALVYALLRCTHATALSATWSKETDDNNPFQLYINEAVKAGMGAKIKPVFVDDLNGSYPCLFLLGCRRLASV